MKYISAKEAADMWGLTKRRVLSLCKEGRIPGAELIGSSWVIPSISKKPIDGRSLRFSQTLASGKDIQPLSSSVKAAGHTPQYKMHKYFARRPYNVFRHIIEHYTKKGDIILDPFCGGGVTVFESAVLGRIPIGVDLNPLATFISRMQMFTGETSELHDYFRRFLLAEEKRYSDWYKVVFEDDEGTALWVEWVYNVECPVCGSTISLSENNKISNGVYRCPTNHCICNKDGIKRISCNTIDSIPIRAKYVSSKTNDVVVRNIQFSNMPIFQNNNFDSILKNLEFIPNFDIPKDWDRQYEDKLYEKGIITYSDFFTQRNYVLNCLVFNDIMKLKGKTGSTLNEYLYFLFSSSLRYTNKMARVTENWEGGKPTAMDKHAFWLPNQYVETNILDVLKQRSKSILKGCSYSAENLSNIPIEVESFDDIKLHNSYMVLNRSSTSLPIPDKSIDVIITDPPYGSNVQYAELSIIWNAWFALYKNLDNYIFNDEEAVVNRRVKGSKAKTEDDYERFLYEVFREGARVLKDNGYLVFTFNNKNIKVWIAMLKAVARAGFYLPENGILFQDYIDSYKNTSHLRFSGNIHGDFIYSFRKGSPNTPYDYSNGFVSIIDQTMKDSISKLFKNKKSYSTPMLYQKMLGNMTSSLMQYVSQCIRTNQIMEDISSISPDYLEETLKKSLKCDNGTWELKK